MFAHLRASLEERPRRWLPHERRAAVLVALVDDGGPLRVLLTRRTEDTPTHKGQVAYPGGGMAPGDLTPADAALREALEEIGLPHSSVEVLGQLDDFPTLNFASVVTPVVGRVATVPPLRPDPREVARIFEVPVDALRDPTGWTVREVERHGVTWPVFYFPWDGEMLWGLSAYITLSLLALTPEGAPYALPEVPLGPR